MTDQLAMRMDLLARARDVEAAAKQDVDDRTADEAKATEKRQRAERCLQYAVVRVEEAWAAVRRQIDAQTHSMFEADGEIDERDYGGYPQDQLRKR